VNEQLILTPQCKERGCVEPIVGSSITGDGHVCRRHNEIEWGKGLASYWPDMSRKLIGATA